MRHGANIDPRNRFGGQSAVPDFEHWEMADDAPELPADRRIEYLPDTSKSIVTENDSPDVSFRYSVNPYRGCVHGCAYCYARPYHEFLGLSAGVDFETKVFVKHDAPALFGEFLSRDAWEPELIAFSGITDCYQPAEREFQVTRGCLRVAWECRQPVGVITKNALITRDLDVLRDMAALGLARVSVSLTTLDAELARVMEPKTSTPAARLRAIAELSAAGVPVNTMVAPVIPGLNDSEIPGVLQAAKEAGSQTASYVLLRLPQSVEPVFRDWLRRTQPLKRQRVEGLIRGSREGRYNSSDFGRRMRGTGEVARQIQSVFEVFAKKLGLDASLPPPDSSQFRRPVAKSGQMRLF